MYGIRLRDQDERIELTAHVSQKRLFTELANKVNL